MDQDFARKRQQPGPQERQAPQAPDTASPLDEDELNPPWDHASGRWPVPAPSAPQSGDTPAPLADPHLGALVERSLPSASMHDFTATGKVTALPPLRPGLSWSRGLKAPRATAAPAISGSFNRAGVEVDDQPSMHIAALKNSTLLRATTIVSVALLVSRIFGMLRTFLFAYTFKYGSVTDAYTLAFTLPDAIFNIVAGGALASAIIPVFNDYMVKKRDRKTAWYVASAALNTSIILLVIFCIISIIFTEPVLRLAFGDIFRGCPSSPTCSGPLAVQLTRIMLLQPIFLGGATVAIALLQARQSFLAPAIGQVIYTLSIVGGIGATLLDNKTGIFGGHLGIYGPTWGVVVGAVLQLLIQIPALVKAKMAYRPVISVHHPGVIEIARLMGPRVLNAAVLYTSVFINRFLLIGLTAGVLTGYQTAMTLILLPNGVIGQALAQAAFPTLSTLVSAGEWDRLRQTVLRSIQTIIYLAIPASLGIMALAKPIATALLDYHNFDPSKLPTVYEPLIFFGIGLTGLALVEILTRSFYALENTRTPTQVSLLQFMFVIGMSILLERWGGPGIALASSLAWTGEAIVLLILLKQEMGGFDFKALGIFTINVLAASVAASLAALLIYMLGEFVLPSGAHSIIESAKLVVRLMVAVSFGGVVYFSFAHFLKIDDVLPLRRILQRIRRR
ncbi:MAG TPA: murein biosynthesis integral membrane protein MurJ [Ktedonobacterales bacterium]